MEIDETILQKVKDANRTRLSKQPLDMPSCGSVFKNPEGHKAAQLIDQCGLKGFRIGDAQVSEKHANFIVNLDQAKAVDIWSVIQHVRTVVQEKKNVSLTTEVVRLGRW
jgi:UDP-N-acetylmuramate dehydrogenase